VFTLPAIELRALTGGVAQKGEGRSSHRDEAIFASCTGQFNKSRSENKTPLDIPTHHAMVF
jgi:hypothetical protein